MRYTSGFDRIQKVWVRERKISRYNFGIKNNSTGFIYLPISKFREAESNLTMMSCLKEAVNNSAPMIG